MIWNLRSEDRLKEWKKFRASISSMPLIDAITETAHLWSYAPFVDHYLDRIQLGDWPNPWALLCENKYDDLGKAYGMINTLCLSNHGRDHHFTLSRIQSQLEIYNIVTVDHGQYVLNYVFDEIATASQIEKDSTVIFAYSVADLQIEDVPKLLQELTPRTS
jgi:hypothetical protein